MRRAGRRRRAAAVVLGRAGVLAVDPARGTRVSSAWHSFKYSGEPVGRRLALRRPRQQPLRLLAGRADRVQAASGAGDRRRQLPRARTCSSGTARRSRSTRTACSSACSRRPASSAPRSSPAFLALTVAAVAPDPARAGPRPGRHPHRRRVRLDPARPRRLALGDARARRARHGAASAPPAGWRRGGAARGRGWRGQLAARPGGRGLRRPRVVAAASFALPWFAQRDIQQATAVWRTDPAAAFSTLAVARIP